MAKSTRPQWTIVTVKPDGTYGPYQINYWEMVWNSQRAAERVIKEMDREFTLKAVQVGTQGVFA